MFSWGRSVATTPSLLLRTLPPWLTGLHRVRGIWWKKGVRLKGVHKCVYVQPVVLLDSSSSGSALNLHQCMGKKKLPYMFYKSVHFRVIIQVCDRLLMWYSCKTSLLKFSPVKMCGVFWEGGGERRWWEIHMSINTLPLSYTKNPIQLPSTCATCECLCRNTSLV